LYKHSVDEDWAKLFDLLPEDIKLQIIKKINRICEEPHKRHLVGNANYFVGEVGQYRIIYRIFERNKEVRFYFVGNHKSYEKWYKSFQ